ncbi:MAG: TonB-dependent receptor [Tannerella sp.]|nr:TonB-dependent receptor [Tannerella sp.]
MKLSDFFSEIEKKTDYVFICKTNVNTSERISVDAVNEEVEEILKKTLTSLGLKYHINDNQVVIVRDTEAENAKTPANTAFQQNPGKTVTGRVTDSQGEPLAGVSIQVKNTTTGNITDANGDFILNNLPDDAVLIFSYVGFVSQEISVKGKNSLDVILQDETFGLEEVVVVAYGTQKKVSVTGAVASIQTKELKQSASANLSTALTGRLPGLTALQTSGQPGNDVVNLYLRGVGTTNGANPLILIDGVPRDNINTLDPNEIASVSILKDASATAVFGVRGANGVILITTRRGETGKAELSVSADYSGQLFTVTPPRLHSWDFAEMENQAFRNDGIAEENLTYTPYMIEMYKSGQDPVFYPDRYAIKEFTKKFAPQTRINANMNGGMGDLKYFLNVGYIGQGGNFKTESKSQLNYDPSFSMDRYNFRGNVDYDIVKNLKLSLNLASYLEKMNSPATELYSGDLMWLISDMLSKVIDLRPTDVGPLTAEGYGVPANEVVAQTGQDRGIYGEINRRGYRQETNTMLNSSLTLDWGLDFITQGLSTKFMMSYDSKARTILEGRRSYDCYNFNVARSANVASSYGTIRDNQDDAIRLSKGMNSYYYMNLQYSLNYVRRFGLHDVTGMFLLQRDNWESSDYAADLPYNMIGFSGRATYGYDNRYLAEVNVGYNGSEQFAPNNRFGFFPAFSAGWVVSNEEFLRDNLILTNLKLRASYGKVGNDKLGGTRFLYLSSITENGGGWISSLGYERYISQGKMGNDQLSWEVAKKQNYGIDLQLLGSLSLNVDVFRENREGILISRGTVPELQGVALGNLPKVNMGKVENKGYEIELSYMKQLNDDLSFTVRGNYAYNENKRIFMDEAMLDEDYAYRYRSTGFSIGQGFGYLIDYSNGNGYINTQEELDNLPEYNVGGTPRLGDFKYVDVNGDGIIDPKDQAPIGYTDIPRITYGFSGSLNYRNVDVSFLFSGIAKSTMSYAGWRYSEQPVQHAWTSERYLNGEEILYPALGNGSSIKANEFFMLDRSFLRLKTAEIGYTVPQQLFRSTGINRIRVYVNGNNLWMYTGLPVKTIDPEQASSGRYPLTKMINVGLNVVF